MSALLHSWSSMGGGSSDVPLAIGDYSLRSNVADADLTVADFAGTVVRTGPGNFRAAIEAIFTVTFGKQPKVIELYQEEN